MSDRIGFALAAGSLAAVNPCGFAMLPAYLVLFTSPDAGVGPRARTGLRRATLGAGAMTLGFATVFGAVGVVLAPIVSTIQRWTPFLTILIGAGLTLTGLAMMAGRGPTLRLPKLGCAPGGPTSGYRSMFLYGLSYAVTSLGCSIGPFAVVVGTSLRSGQLATGLVSYLAYAAGMGLVVALTGASVVLARRTRLYRWRRVAPALPILSGALVTSVGSYLDWYGIYELRLNSGQDVHDPVIEAAARVQAQLADWIDRVGPVRLATALIVLLTGAAAAKTLRRPTNSGSRHSTPLLGEDDAEQ